jgi:hypothetical protein
MGWSQCSSTTEISIPKLGTKNVEVEVLTALVMKKFYNAVYSDESQPTSRRKISALSSGLKNM